MRKIFVLVAILTTIGAFAQQKGRQHKSVDRSQSTVNAIVDLSHAFSFYADGRFATQYLKGQNAAMCWGNLHDADLTNTNLLILLSCEDRAPYTNKDFSSIKKYVEQGGGLVILGNPTLKSQNQLAEQLAGATFEGTTTEKLAATKYTSQPIENQGKAASTLKLNRPQAWEVVVKDAKGAPVVATTKLGKGKILVGSRSVAGSHPNASDSINTKLWQPLLLDIASGKKINTNAPNQGRGWNDLGHTERRGELEISYTDYLAPYADAMFDISARAMPMIEKRMGVPLSPGMGSKIMLLATDGGGFSSGESIALAVWWGDFPKKEDSMIEFITHESVHSWVLPFPEIWNEPIATYVGNLVMMDMGHKEEAERRIAQQIDRARKIDPDFNLYDLQGRSHRARIAPVEQSKVNDLHWGKTYWIWEQLRAEKPNIVAEYFKVKRAKATNEVVKKYDDNNTVAILSIAMGKDMFPWFRSIGFDVERSKADVKF